jgi:putative selenate reductase
MNDRMTPIPFDKLVQWVLNEYKYEHSIFGIPAGKFYRKTDGKLLNISGKAIKNPLGPAAGPHTQLAQNIIAAYLTGSRYFELKTVQLLDGEDLPVSKPCILAKDEGYNVEWSTELTVPDAYNEYVKAYFMLNVLAKELQLGSRDGFAFNMSVGYDLQGIQSPKIDHFIENQKDASKTAVWKECKAYLLHHIDEFKNVDAAFIDGISPNVCSSITLSTLHGCPRQEIEKIAGYLMGVKKLNVFIKCNPTLLGYEFARKTLDELGYDYLSFDDHHFKEDLQYEDAVPMIKRLQSTANELKLDFGVKLTNTFPVAIKGQELPGDEMYMSGRALYPLTVSLAARLAESFGGDLRISYSGGADYFSIADILGTGIWPVTFATTLLKPGGYARIKQLAETAENLDIPTAFTSVSVSKLKTLADSVKNNAVYQKGFKETENRKLKKTVPLTDCFIAPCKEGCPIGQDAPEYIRLNEEGRYREAFELITSKNPFPFTTGTICSRFCMSKCTRMDYDKPVDIRAAKLTAAKKGCSEIPKAEKPALNSASKAAVIGAGPAGLSAAYFLAKNGVEVTVFEKRERLGGILAYVIPDFRLPEEALSRDLELIKNTGVHFKLGVSGDITVEALKKDGYEYIFIATGAWKPGAAGFETDGGNVCDVLDFLEKFKRGCSNIGKNVAVIGAGNSAMDAARAAKRIPGVEHVTIIYRRTKKLVPADREELNLALEDGVVFKELLAPVSYKNGILKCQMMGLGAPDASGRRSPVPLDGQYDELSADYVITAVGQKTDEGLLRQNGILLDKNGRIMADPQTNETGIANVFVGGDLLRGPATVVEAIADGQKFAKTVLGRENITPKTYELTGFTDQARQLQETAEKKGVLQRSCKGESGKCLECNAVCNICVEVCPNRANVAVKVPGMTCVNQVIHIDGLCNACGNCEAFCPYASAPYMDKFTLYWNEADFDAGENQGFWVSDINTRSVKVRIGNQTINANIDADGNCDCLPKEIAGIIRAVLKDYQYTI